MDISTTIEPRSDQLNADDLLVGPRTVTITDVTVGSAEQPVHIHLAEVPGRPWKPSKSMRRILVAIWGPDASTYIGQRVTLYRDPDVTFGRDRVGGIRISHMTGLSEPRTVSLTVTRGKRRPYTVQPLTDVAAPVESGRHRLVRTHLQQAGVTADVDTVLADAAAAGVEMTPEGLGGWLHATYPPQTTGHKPTEGVVHDGVH